MKFYKYQGAGNDFIMVDQRAQQALARADRAQIKHLCDRRFGIGADGLILLENRPGYDFEMVYFNADGGESTLCGNGGRCIAAFAKHLGIVGDRCRFMAIDGEHEAVSQTRAADRIEWVELKMGDVNKIEQKNGAFVLNTGSPHYVRFVEALDAFDLVAEGRAVRYSATFAPGGINANFAEAKPGFVELRTYERGVEDETLACGTGATAVAIAHHARSGGAPGPTEIALHTRGGDLAVRFTALPDGTFRDVWLCGPAEKVFEGSYGL
jgi:diaminopimelate epimerase